MVLPCCTCKCKNIRRCVKCDIVVYSKCGCEPNILYYHIHIGNKCIYFCKSCLDNIE